MNKATLFSDAIIVTPNDHQTVDTIMNAFCVTYEDTIRYVGQSRDDALKVIDALHVSYDEYSCKKKILAPTFANAHNHMPMTLLRNVADDKALEDWLFGEILPREDKMIAEDYVNGLSLSIAEMISGGIGCSQNQYESEIVSAQTAMDAGFRVQQTILGKHFDGTNWHADEAQASSVMAFIQSDKSDLIHPAMVVHSIYLYPEYLYQPLSDLAELLKLPISVHISETRTEMKNCMERYGVSPVKKLDSFGMLKPDTIAAHCVNVSSEDMDILKERGVWVTHNPSSNMKLASGIMNMKEMLARGVKMTIGTDGASSNNNQSMYMEMRMASFLAKVSTYEPTMLTAAQILYMATRNGYLSMGYNHCGLIQEGMQADIQIVDYDCPSMWPLGNPVSALVYSAMDSCVESVMIRGKFVMNKREFTTIDWEKVSHNALSSSRRINSK